MHKCINLSIHLFFYIYIINPFIIEFFFFKTSHIQFSLSLCLAVSRHALSLSLSLSLSVYIYIYMHHLHFVVLLAGIALTLFLSLSLTTRLYHPSLPAGLPGYIMCPYKAVV